MRLPNASRGFLETAQPAGAPGRAAQGPRPAGVLFPDNKGEPLADASLTPARPGVCLLIDCRGGLYRLPTDRPRSASNIHQMPHASSSIMPIPITSTASATGS